MEREADYSPPTNAEVKKIWIISIPQYAFMVGWFIPVAPTWSIGHP
jgi:hypothetical protein